MEKSSEFDRGVTSVKRDSYKRLSRANQEQGKAWPQRQPPVLHSFAIALSGDRIGRGKCCREPVGRAAIDDAPITPAHAKVFMDTSVGEYLAEISRQPDGPPGPP